MRENRSIGGDRQRVQRAVLAIDFVLGALYGPKRCRCVAPPPSLELVELNSTF